MKHFNSLFDIRRYKKTFLIIIFVSTLTLLISSALSIWLSSFHNLSVPSVGTVKTIGVEAYQDKNCKNKTEKIEWGVLWPGIETSVTLYIRSISNVKTSLQLNASNITPAAISEYVTLTWDYDGKPLGPGRLIKLTLFLSTSSNEEFTEYLQANYVTKFNIDVHIVAFE